jgi:hypothetical protein
MMKTTAPPRVSAWLVDLFASREQSETILGDLLEEFTAIAARDGEVAARRGYRRQSASTIVHLLIGQARLAPWWTALWAISGVVLFNLILGGIRGSAVAVAAHYRVYDHVSAVAYWQAERIAERYATPLLVGLLVAGAARGREMLAAAAVCSTAILWTVMALPIAVLLASDVQRRELTWAVVPNIVASNLMLVALILAGAAMVRRMRPSTPVSLRA